MPYRTTPLINGQYYHLYNRGLAKRNIFSTPKDYQRFIQTFFYYQIQNPKPKFSLYQDSSLYKIDPSKKTVDILCFCLMPNHFHLLIKQLQDDGTSEFMRRFIHSYNKYWNTKHDNFGPLLQGMFKAVLIESEEQLTHLSRYIHLNPLVAGITNDLNSYQWSSYYSYITPNDKSPVAKDEILQFFSSAGDYEKFVLDQADYGKTLELLKHNTIDIKE